MTKYMNRTNTPKITWNEVQNATAYEITLDDGGNTTEILNNEFELINAGFNRATSTDDGDYTFKVRTKKGEEVSSFSEGFDFTLDSVLPTNPQWTVGVGERNTAYTDRSIILTGSSDLDESSIEMTTQTGGIISNIRTDGLSIIFDLVTPDFIGDTITISGKSISGNIFSVDIDTPALS